MSPLPISKESIQPALVGKGRKFKREQLVIARLDYQLFLNPCRQLSRPLGQLYLST